jgi:hypothetical protein
VTPTNPVVLQETEDGAVVYQLIVPRVDPSAFNGGADTIALAPVVVARPKVART